MRRGGEPDLVVHDEVDRAARAMPAQTREAEPFGHDALPGECGVAVQEDADDFLALGIAHLVLLGAHLAEDDRVDRLEVRGVGRQRQVHGVVVEDAVRRCAEVVFHVPRAINVLGLERSALKLVEDRAVGLLHDVWRARKAARGAACRSRSPSRPARRRA